MGQWLSERSFGEILCLMFVVGAVVEGIILAMRGRD